MICYWFYFIKKFLEIHTLHLPNPAHSYRQISLLGRTYRARICDIYLRYISSTACKKIWHYLTVSVMELKYCMFYFVWKFLREMC